jgi:large subunit ribosomal protein L24
MVPAPSVSRKAFSARLSADLVEEYNVRSMPIRKGDTITIMRGSFRGIEGKVTRVDRKTISIYVEGVTREKSDGNTIFIPLPPSKVMITRLNLDDDRRRDILERKASNIVGAMETRR